MSDTPRTDKLFGGFAATDDGYWKVLDHARQLERELAAKDTEKASDRERLINSSLDHLKKELQTIDDKHDLTYNELNYIIKGFGFWTHSK